MRSNCVHLYNRTSESGVDECRVNTVPDGVVERQVSVYSVPESFQVLQVIRRSHNLEADAPSLNTFLQW